jgi:hypothetical protein
MLDCVWMTVADWATLDGVDPDFFDRAVPQGGPTYTRVCADGTVWLNATLAAAIRDA